MWLFFVLCFSFKLKWYLLLVNSKWSATPISRSWDTAQTIHKTKRDHLLVLFEVIDMMLFLNLQNKFSLIQSLLSNCHNPQKYPRKMKLVSSKESQKRQLEAFHLHRLRNILAFNRWLILLFVCFSVSPFPYNLKFLSFSRLISFHIADLKFPNCEWLTCWKVWVFISDWCCGTWERLRVVLQARDGPEEAWRTCACGPRVYREGGSLQC